MGGLVIVEWCVTGVWCDGWSKGDVDDGGAMAAEKVMVERWLQ